MLLQFPKVEMRHSAIITDPSPISLLSLVSKTFERIIHNQLLNFLLKHSRISRFQFGFRPNSSTQEALLHLTNEWHQQLDSGNQLLPSFLTYQRHSIQFHMISFWRVCSVSESVALSSPGLKTIWPAPTCGVGWSHLSCSPCHIRSPPDIYPRATPFHHLHELHLWYSSKWWL